MTFFPICILLSTMCMGVLSAEPVSGHVGSTVVLPCKLQGEVSEIPYIRWLIKSETVFERQGHEKYQAVEYKDRVDISEEELHKGNCSLVLQNLKQDDAAVYKSYEVVRRTKRSDRSKRSSDLILISKVQLQVSVKPTDEESSEVALTGDAGMKCPHPQIVLSLLSLFFHFFGRET